MFFPPEMDHLCEMWLFSPPLNMVMQSKDKLHITSYYSSEEPQPSFDVALHVHPK